MSNDEDCCQNCVCFQRMSGAGGLCRRFPKQVCTPADKDGDFNLMFYYPEVDNHEWCYEHKANQERQLEKDKYVP